MTNSCPTCGKQTIRQQIIGFTYVVCYQCYSIGFSQTTLQTLLKSETFQNLGSSLRGQIGGTSCFSCASATRQIVLQARAEYADNLRVFRNWKYWYDFHRKGPLQVFQCQKCGACWMNTRTFCQFQIDWHDLEVSHAAKLPPEEASGIKLTFNDPFRFLMGMVLGVPQLENVPSISQLPMLTYICALVVSLFTSRGFKNPDLIGEFAFAKSRISLNQMDSWLTLFSHALVHMDRSQFFGSLFFFLVFAPMVEHELSMTNFILMLASCAAGSALFQAVLLPDPVVGFGGVAAGVLAFFCVRFPASVIGYGIFRLSAPVALSAILFFDILSVIKGSQDSGDPIRLVNLGGACCGYLFSVIMPTGSATQAFKKMAQERLMRERKLKNWGR